MDRREFMKCGAAVCQTLAVLSAAADSIPEARRLIASNSIDRTVNCRYYKAWYIDGCDKAELDAMFERNIEGHKRWMALAGSDAISPQCDLGLMYGALGKWKEAKEELSKVFASLASGRYMDAIRKSQAHWEMANILWKEGDRKGAKEHLAKAAEPYRTDKIDSFLSVAGRAKYLSAMLDDPDGDIDMLKLPHSVDGRPFPTPQEAEYGDGRVSLAKVELRVATGGTGRTSGTGAAGLSGLDDPIVRLLTRKLQRFGSKLEKGGTPVTIEISPDAPVDRPQGYSLDVASGSVSVRARTRTGATWGVVSLLQCIDRERIAVGECSIRDWPACVKRGVTPYWEPDYLEHALFYKVAVVDFTMNRQYTLSPLDKELFRTVSSRFADFGIELNIYTDSLDVRPLPPFSSPRTWKLHLAWAKFLASIGAGNIKMYDDDRFPMHPKDIEAAGTAANLDAKFVTRLYREVKKDYPDFRMEFCPPFYWGPYGDANYPEPRDEYLKSLARDLDPEIDVWWTGPYVKTSWMNEKTVGWITNLIGRKPAANSNGNGIGQHNYIPFGTDLPGYKESHATNLFDMVASFRQNTSNYRDTCWLGSCMDWCWNPEAHDPRTAVRRAIDIVEGPGVFEALESATPALSYFDKYVYGRPRVEVLTEDLADLDAKVAVGEAAWEKAMSLAKNGGMFVSGFKNCGIKWAKRIADARRNPPEEFVKERDAIMANTAFARKEAAYDEAKGDEFLPAEMLNGGKLNPKFSTWTPGGDRAVKYVSPGETLTGTFSCDLFPPETPFRLVILGQSFIKEPCVVEVSVNGNVVWSGEPFIVYYFKPLEIGIPVVAMKRNNMLEIKCTSPAGTRRKAVIHYVVVKKR